MKQHNSTPLVSIVSPVYNCEEFLSQFIESIQNQTLREWELILVDDGSTDNSVAVERRYAEKDCRITYIEAEHSNAGNARNIGLSRACGEYICFLDSDDFCRPQMLKRMLDTAHEKEADIVLCQTDSYSMKNDLYMPMGWTLVPKYIPETPDGCYNGELNSRYLFQSTIVSPWNKMMRLQMLRDNNIQAQSQMAANDVVLCCTALACAKRIYPLYESLYVQRRDNPHSITGNLDTDEKHMCGYTASLGLLNELKRLGKYEQLKETYQRLAIHNCIWYLEKSSDNAERFKNDYVFLQNEGFKNLELMEIHFGISYGKSNPDAIKYLSVRDQPIDEYYRLRAKVEWRARKKMEEEANRLRMSKDYRLGHFLLYLPRKAVHAYRKIRDIHPFHRHQLQKRYSSSSNRIAFFAMESFHYDVVENMMRICNPEKNYLIAYVHTNARNEISKMLGELSSLVEWHTFASPNLRHIPAKSYSNEELLTWFIQDAISKKDLDYIILPSPEYHPEWYLPLLEEQNKHYKVVAGVHNLNTVFASNNQDEDMYRLFELADQYGVINTTLKTTMEENGWSSRPICVFPQIYSPGFSHDIPEEGVRVSFVITGIVEKERKDYQSVVNALSLVPELHSKIRLTLLGKAKNEYAESIVSQFNEMKATGLEFVSFSDYVPIEDFNKTMERADYLLGPIVIETDNKGITEYYGKTKISGIIGDIIRYARPAIVIDSMKIPDELDSSIICYHDEKDLANILRRLINHDVLKEFCETAQRNSEKYLLEHHIWN